MLILTGVELIIILGTALVQMYCIKNLFDNRLVVWLFAYLPIRIPKISITHIIAINITNPQKQSIAKSQLPQPLSQTLPMLFNSKSILISGSKNNFFCFWYIYCFQMLSHCCFKIFNHLTYYLDMCTQLFIFVTCLW